MTRKQTHAQAVQFLKQAAELVDQAHAFAKDARCELATTVDAHGGSYIGLRRFSYIAERMANEADTAVCDDCGLLIAACDCKWANEDVNA